MRQKPDLSFWKLWNLSFGFLEIMESEFRILWRTDRLCFAECQYLAYLPYARCRSPLTEFLLDPPTAYGYPCATDCRNTER